MISRIGKTGSIHNDWSWLVKWVYHALKRKTTVNTLAKIALQARIYQVWREMNLRTHDHISITSDEVVQMVLQEVKDSLYFTKVWAVHFSS